VDAIAAVSIVLIYVLPHLGSDFLALVHRGGRVEAVVGFGWAPKKVPKRPPRRGLQSAVVPGYVAGLYELHRRHGSLPWERVVDTAPEAMEKPLCTPRWPLP
jgi:gamma-glutamyltranspeptidase/glutathione hydrolase